MQSKVSTVFDAVTDVVLGHHPGTTPESSTLNFNHTKTAPAHKMIASYYVRFRVFRLRPPNAACFGYPSSLQLIVTQLNQVAGAESNSVPTERLELL